MFNSPRSLVDALGGYRAVAARLGKRATTIHGYISDRKLPAKFFDAFDRLCVEAGFDSPPRELFGFVELNPHIPTSSSEQDAA